MRNVRALSNQCVSLIFMAAACFTNAYYGEDVVINGTCIPGFYTNGTQMSATDRQSEQLWCMMYKAWENAQCDYSRVFPPGCVKRPVEYNLVSLEDSAGESSNCCERDICTYSGYVNNVSGEECSSCPCYELDPDSGLRLEQGPVCVYGNFSYFSRCEASCVHPEASDDDIVNGTCMTSCASTVKNLQEEETKCENELGVIRCPIPKVYPQECVREETRYQIHEAETGLLCCVVQRCEASYKWLNKSDGFSECESCGCSETSYDSYSDAVYCADGTYEFESRCVAECIYPEASIMSGPCPVQTPDDCEDICVDPLRGRRYTKGNQ
eukprot:m.187268 g.187268  ORF g.187268 m.187268 type:complete len:325 (-) comp15604_c0_seq2:3148-4122(-)